MPLTTSSPVPGPAVPALPPLRPRHPACPVAGGGQAASSQVILCHPDGPPSCFQGWPADQAPGQGTPASHLAGRLLSISTGILGLVSLMCLLPVQEFAYLRLLALFGPDQSCSSLRRVVEPLADRLLSSLAAHTKDSSRFPRLLLCLAPLRSLQVIFYLVNRTSLLRYLPDLISSSLICWRSCSSPA